MFWEQGAAFMRGGISSIKQLQLLCNNSEKSKEAKRGIKSFIILFNLEKKKFTNTCTSALNVDNRADSTCAYPYLYIL